MRTMFIFLSVFFSACTNGAKEDKNHKQAIKDSTVTIKDSIITLQMHVKKGEMLSFGYVDDAFNFVMIETPEKSDTNFYERKIISHKPLFLRNISHLCQYIHYLIPGETYKITADSIYSNFEVVGNAKRTYEVNIFKELKKQNRKLKYGNEYNCDDVWKTTNFNYKKNSLSIRDSLLKIDYEQELSFINDYASKNNFDNMHKLAIIRNGYYAYMGSRFNFVFRDAKTTQKYLAENKKLYKDALKEINCDSCFESSEYYHLLNRFAVNYIADPEKIGVEAAYKAYNNYFTSKTKDYLLFDLIKFGGMFNYTKPNPVLAKLFLNDAHDPVLKNEIKEIYAFLDAKKSSTGTLSDMSGASFSWNNILEKHKGKVIYIDFWASWCVPCRVEMPASKLLHKQLTGKSVVFLYISTEKNIIDWKKAAKAEGIANAESYIVAKPEKFELTKQYKISSIPRYFLIDKNGKIVNANAQRPSSNTIANDIKQLL